MRLQPTADSPAANQDSPSFPPLHTASHGHTLLELTSDFAYSARVESDDDIVIEWANGAYESITGFRLSDLLTVHSWPRLVHPLDEAVALEHRRRVLSGNQSSVTFRIVDSRGSTRLIHQNASPVLDASGKLTHILVAGTDITDRARMESFLRLQHDQLVALARCTSIPEACAAVLTAVREIDCCDGGGVYVRDESDGFKLVEHFGLSDRFVESVKYYAAGSPGISVIESGRPVFSSNPVKSTAFNDLRFEERLQTIAVIPLLDGTDVIGALNVCSRSIPEFPEDTRAVFTTIGANAGAFIARLRTDELLRQADARLREALKTCTRFEQLKDTFIATISHGIRTPLNLLVGAADMLLESARMHPDAPVDGRILDSVHDASSRLLRNLEHVLEVSSLRAGTLSMSPDALDLPSTLERMARRFRLEAEAKGLTLSYSCSGESAPVHADRHCIERAFSHLLDNAVKFTSQGGIDLCAMRVNGTWQVTIKDTGVGISEDYLPHMFSLFAPESEGYAFGPDGLGLGMALAKMYIESSRGSINVTSGKGEGTEVVVRIPVA